MPVELVVDAEVFGEAFEDFVGVVDGDVLEDGAPLGAAFVPGHAEATGEFFAVAGGTDDGGFVEGDDATAAGDVGLEGGVLGVCQLWEVEVHDEEVGFFELFVRGEAVGGVDGDFRDAGEEAGHEVADAEVVVGTGAVAGVVAPDPSDVDSFGRCGVGERADDFFEVGFGDEGFGFLPEVLGVGEGGEEEGEDEEADGHGARV